MLSISISQPPFSPPKSKPPLSNYKLFRDVTAISHSPKLLPLAVSKRGSDLVPLNLEANGEKHPKEKKKQSIGESELDFVRYNISSDDADVAGELQASIVSYKKSYPRRFLNPNFQVDLVSAIHIADETYFKTIQEKLSAYDCVLYEGVTDKDKDKNKNKEDDDDDDDKRNYSIIALIQRLIGAVLSLDFQLDRVNYKGKNWYNADLDYDTFLRLQEERGESLFSLASDSASSALKSSMDSTTPQSLKSRLLRISYILPMPLALSLIINATCSPPKDNIDESLKENEILIPKVGEFIELGFGSGLKAFLARALSSADMSVEINENSVIIGERNKAAIEELKKAISRGDKKIAIFYGAGHMMDLGKRLKREFNLVPCDINWVTAWAIKRPKGRNLGPVFEKYVGRYLPFSERNLDVLVVGLLFGGFVLFDLVIWASIVDWVGVEVVSWAEKLSIV